MSDAASHLALVPLSTTIVRRVQAMHLDQNITEAVEMYACLAESMRSRGLTYLTLPPVLSWLADDRLYQEALLWGRGIYQDDLYLVDESDKVFRNPLPWSRAEIFEMVRGYLSLDDPRVCVSVALSWRVGMAVGWLSGLASSQKDDAQAAMVLLATLVTPLLASSRPVHHHRKQALRSPGSRSRRAKKSRSR